MESPEVLSWLFVDGAASTGFGALRISGVFSWSPQPQQMQSQFPPGQSATTACAAAIAATNVSLTYGKKPMLQTTAHNVGHVLIMVLRTTFQTTVLTRPFVSAHNTLDHLIAETPDLQSAVIITTDSAQEAHAHFSTSKLNVILTS